MYKSGSTLNFDEGLAAAQVLGGFLPQGWLTAERNANARGEEKCSFEGIPLRKVG
jgi:hypothetical protein